jgi:exonuclease III
MIFKVLTYNIWFSDININERLTKLLYLLNKENPDIICLQEVRKDVLAILVNKLKIYKFWETSLNENKTYGVVIFSKFKNTKTNIYKFKKTNMDRHFVIMELDLLDNKKINIVTTHLESEFKKYNLKNTIKYHQFTNLLSYLKCKNNVILGGDMNISNEENDVYILDKFWDDCWILNGSDNNKKYTYDCNTNIFINKKTKYKSRLDRIYIKKNGNLELKDFSLIGKGEGIIPSDHYGIIVKIEL